MLMFVLMTAANITISPHRSKFFRKYFHFSCNIANIFATS